MSQTVGDFIIERLHAWGVRRIFGYPGDGINGVFGALNRAQAAAKAKARKREPRASDRIHSGAPRGNGRLHGIRACQIHRRTRRVHRDLGTRRVASADRPVRRAHGSHAGARDHRAAGARRAWRPLSAGTRSCFAVQGRRRARSCSRRVCRRRSAIWSIARCARRSPSARSPPHPAERSAGTCRTKRPRASTARCIRASAISAPNV